MKKWLPLLFLLAGCGEEIPSAHEAYVESFGWHLDEMESEETTVVDYVPESHESLQSAGLDLMPYDGKNVTITTYLLEEEQENGDGVSISIYENENEIIGAVGLLEEWAPGLFSLNRKEELIEEGMPAK